MAEFVYDGRRVHYREAGEGPLLLLIPGNTASSAVHQGEMDYFAATHRVVAVDLPGTGASERMTVWPDDWWEYGARCVGELIEHLGAGPAVPLGTSGGAVVALLAAQLAPDLVRGVVADSCVERQSPEMLERVVAERRVADDGLKAFWRAAHGEDWSQVIKADSDAILRLAARDGVWFTRDLSLVRSPVLLTGSLRDAMLHDGPAQMVSMASRMSRSELYLANDGDHPFLWSAADRFRTVATSFLARLEEPDGEWARSAGPAGP